MAGKADLIERFMDSSDAFAYLKDEKGRYLMVNRKAAEVAKWSKDEFIGKTDYDIFPTKSRRPESL
jgi:PAS domain S-box-containing protein